jgi:hypothetical protein
MKELVEHIVTALVDHPEDINITEVDGERTVIFELRCHAEDIGKVIGKSGKTVSAIRTLLNTAAAKQGRRAMLEVVD